MNYEEIEELLEVLYQATLVFSINKHPTSNQFFLVLQKKYWAENSLVFIIACVLDPKYKLGRVEFIFRKLYPLEADYTIQIGRVDNALKEIYKFQLWNSVPQDYFPSNENSDIMFMDEEELERYNGYTWTIHGKKVGFKWIHWRTTY